jgi:hypothetical protein
LENIAGSIYAILGSIRELEKKEKGMQNFNFQNQVILEGNLGKDAKFFEKKSSVFSHFSFKLLI